MKIAALVTVVAIAYGIAHDQVTARVCLEYFTIGHPPLIPTESPTLLALGWGIVATWWVGLPLGVLLAAVARIGPKPRLSARDLRRPIVLLLATMGGGAVLAGAVGGVLATFGLVWLVPPMSELVQADRHTRFLIDLWAHSASYLIGILGGAVVIFRTWRRRTPLDAPE